MLAPREFKQARSAATYEALLHAAARVFARRGFDAAQTPEIAAEAGVSTGAFYRYFTDKRAIFVEVVAHHLRQSQEEVMAKLTPERFVGDGKSVADKRRAIDMVLDVLFDRVRRDAELERVYLSMSYSDPDVRRLRAQYEDEGCQALTRLLEIIVPREVIPDAAAAARVIGITAVEIAADRAGLRPRVGTGGGSDAAIKAALREMLVRFLFPDALSAAPAAPRERRKR
ncbi:MAG: transcriptional regulator, TetR family [bacterium]|nr:transcriptional regulator, TetR family [bacterium]